MGVNMEIPKDAVLLRIFIGEDDKAGRQPLYEAIVLKAREMHLAGATILRGPMGFGRSSRLHTTKILRLSEDLPIIIEIVDAEQKINEFLPILDAMMGSGLVTLEKAKVLRYGTHSNWSENYLRQRLSDMLRTGGARSRALRQNDPADAAIPGDIHLTSDILHIVAVGAWIGGLLPYVLLLKTFRGEPAAIVATQRFKPRNFCRWDFPCDGRHQCMELSRQRRGALGHRLRAPADGEGGVIFDDARNRHGQPLVNSRPD